MGEAWLHIPYYSESKLMCCLERRRDDTWSALGSGTWGASMGTQEEGLYESQTASIPSHPAHGTEDGISPYAEQTCDSGRRVGCMNRKSPLPFLVPKSRCSVSRDSNIYLPTFTNPPSPFLTRSRFAPHPVPRCRVYCTYSILYSCSFPTLQRRSDGIQRGGPHHNRGMVRPGTSASTEVVALMAV